jgi:hypothetical protein
MERRSSHYNSYPRLLQKAQGSRMFISRVPHMVCFVNDDSEKCFPKDGAGECLLHWRNVPGAGPFFLFSMRPLEVIKESLQE